LPRGKKKKIRCICCGGKRKKGICGKTEDAGGGKGRRRGTVERASQKREIGGGEGWVTRFQLRGIPLAESKKGGREKNIILLE